MRDVLVLRIVRSSVLRIDVLMARQSVAEYHGRVRHVEQRTRASRESETVSPPGQCRECTRMTPWS